MEISHADKLRLSEAVDMMIDHIYYKKLPNLNKDMQKHYEYELKCYQELKKRLSGE